MTATVSKAGPYYTSGEIKFSSLRSNFRAQVRKETSSGSETFNADTAAIKASELLKNTTITDTSPKVPDSTENANISTSSNWKLSQFRGSIKYYYITQSGTNLNFDIDSPPDSATWNSNLDKNINKFLFVDGTCGSESVSTPAAILNQSACNLTIDTVGNIFGAGGRGGGTGSGAPAISGEQGGDALEILSSGFQSLNTTQSYNTISGVDSNLLSVDIYYNSNVAVTKPTVIYIHGGAWALGDKGSVDSKATFFTNLGYVFVSVNYRLSPAANMIISNYNFFVGDDGTIATASTRVKHPTHVNDAANAVTWVYNNISSYGGDPNKLILIGHSAGAHLVSLLSTNQSYLTSAGLPSGKIIGCIANDSEAISGIYQQIIDPVSDGNADPAVIKGWYNNAFGIYPDKTVSGTINNITTDYATTTAAQTAYTAASPISHVSASTPPFLVLCRGSSSRIDRETQFVTALQNVGATVTSVSYPDSTSYTHQEINKSIGSVNDPPAGKSLPSGVSNVTTQIENWITSLASPPAVSTITANNINVLVRSTAKIYAGGGGGEKGPTGAKGADGKCTNYANTSGCGGAPGCPDGYSQTGESSGGCCQTYSYCCGLFNCGCTACSQYMKYRSCKQEYTTSGGDGGAGGNGGPGRGYNYQTGSLDGAEGSNGAPSPDNPSCGAESGEKGGSGAAGGEWATAGGDTTNSGDGGGVGKAITGSNYSVTGTINSSTVKGAYNP